MSDAIDHAPFAPSGLHRIVACPGSFNLIRKAREAGVALDESDTPQSMEGTAAHWVASQLLETGEIVEAGRLAPNGVAVTDEMIEGVLLFEEAVKPYLYGARVEQHISCASIHHNCDGTPDFAFGPWGGVLFISDYKFGHRYVDVFENVQLLAYALGVMPEYLPSVRVILQIVQPRSYHRDGPVRTWETTGEALWSTYRPMLAEACRAAESPDARCTVGPHCYKCPAIHVCDAAQRAELAAFDLSGTTAPLIMSADAKSLRLRQVQRAAQQLKEIESGLSEDVTAMIRRGENVPGFTIESSVGRLKWTAPAEEVIALGVAMGVDVSKPALITPTQARKAGMGDVVDAYAARDAGSTKLVQVDADRMRRVFTTKEV